MLFKRTWFGVKLILSALLFLAPAHAYVSSFDTNATYEVYFTPKNNCTAQIIRTLQEAKHEVYVQAYFLTSAPIIDALVDAKLRQVEVNVILDKKHPENQAGIKKMLAVDIPVWIDQKTGIAHNKVMIIDAEKVITGSFNFTYSANNRNRENLLVIRDTQLAKHYLKNWHRCQAHSLQEAPLKKKAKEPTLKENLNALEKLLLAIARFLRTLIASINVVLEGI